MSETQKSDSAFDDESMHVGPIYAKALLAAAQAARANLVVVSGDSHNAWGFDLANENRPAGVEFAGQSVASFGFEARFDADPGLIARDLVASNPALKWCDTSRRGYMTVTLGRDAVRSDWLFLETVARRSTALSGTHGLMVGHGGRLLESV